MKSRIQFGLSVVGLLYFLLVLYLGLYRVQQTTAHVDALRQSAAELSALDSPTKKLSNDDPSSMLLRCTTLFQKSTANNAEMVALQFQALQMASSQEVSHAGVGAGLFAVLSLLSWKRRDKS